MRAYVAATAADRDKGRIGDAITGSSYAVYGANPDKDGTFYISLVLSADGACAFKSTCSSLWPCDGLIIELPPKQRCRMENAITFGFWIGRLDCKKPQWDLFLPSIIDEIRFLNKIGFIVDINGKNLQFKVRLHATIFDSPALASAWSIKQYNGKHKNILNYTV